MAIMSGLNLKFSSIVLTMLRVMGLEQVMMSCNLGAMRVRNMGITTWMLGWLASLSS
jgi:hypothetical protein